MSENKDKESPPCLATRFLRWYCRLELLDEVEGDLYELFQRRVEARGLRQAQLLYWLNVLMFFHPDYIRKKHNPQNPTVMFSNYLKVAFRHLTKHQLYSAINVLGLTLAFGFCTLIWLFVSHELSFDTHYPKADRIYRAWVKEIYPDQTFFNTVTPIPLGSALESNYPEVKETVRVGIFSSIVSQGDVAHSETITMVDPGFFTLFETATLAGKPDLSELRQGVITEATATKYFGEGDPVGKLLEIQLGETAYNFTVTGVVENPPATSSLAYEILIPFENFRLQTGEQAWSSWYNVSVETYVLLREDAAVASLESKFPTMVEQVLGEDYVPDEYNVGLQPLTDIHLNADFPPGIVDISDHKYVYILSGIAILILLVASINFITLALGRSINRAKEVGVRKSLGARQGQLMVQFWGEAFLATVLSLLLGGLLAYLLLPTFNQLANRELTLALSPDTIIFLLSLTLLIALLAGVYPALLTSRFAPTQILRNDLGGTVRQGRLQQAMIAFQFVISVGLIISTLVMNRQLRYLQDKNLGFNPDPVVVVPQNMRAGLSDGIVAVVDEGRQRKLRLEQALEQIPEVQQVSNTIHTFGQAGWTEIGFTTDDGQYRECVLNIVDADFVPTYQLDMVEGRNFRKGNLADERTGVLINQTFAQAFGLTDPVGSQLPAPFEAYQVLGVVRDFHYQSLHHQIVPVLLAINPEGIFSQVENINIPDSPDPKISINLQTERLSETMARLEQLWANVAPDQQFDYYFVDERLNAQYRQEKRLGEILSITTVVSLLVSCLGLFGLVTLAVSNRVKEIGIRKVLGASVAQIMALIYQDFMKLIGIALVFAVPLAYFLMKRWLADFPYRTNLGASTLLVAAIIVMVLAFITIAYQSVRAARMNPVTSLRDE